MKDFIKPQAKVLPVIILADVSSSMSGEPIQSLNKAMFKMIESFKGLESYQADIHVSVICFGANTREHIKLQSVSEITWENMQAGGMTPLGQALDIAKELIEDKNRIPSKAYRPVCVLLSDGEPNDAGWEQKLDDFINNGRTKKVDRYALAIGDDADIEMLKKFINNEKKSVLKASDAKNIVDFFKLLTMSISVRSKSVNPNDTSTDNPMIPDPKLRGSDGSASLSTVVDSTEDDW